MKPIAAQVVVPCTDLDATLQFLTERLGFLVELVSPADDPAVVVVTGHGVRLRLERVAAGAEAAPVTLFLGGDDSGDGGAAGDDLTPPDGLALRFAPAVPPIDIPPLHPSFVISRFDDATGFHPGRAGMGYRDLVPDRQGGRFIASHIRIDDAGSVPDYVHFHEVRFQMIYCAHGWVRVVYEDQGEPFVMHAGDCVLQPPTIRHCVLEASAGLEVVELGCPAVHDTRGDPTMSLPTGRSLPDRSYGDDRTGRQRFVRHVAADAAWMPHRFAGFEHRDTGIAAATDGLAGARVLRPLASPPSPPSPTSAPTSPTSAHPSPSIDSVPVSHDGELWFGFVTGGSVGLDVGGEAPIVLGRSDSVVIPPGRPFRFHTPSPDLELLEVTLPAG